MDAQDATARPPRGLRRLRPGDFRVMTWKNGLGTTTELAVDPPGASLDALGSPSAGSADLLGPPFALSFASADFSAPLDFPSAFSAPFASRLAAFLACAAAETLAP